MVKRDFRKLAKAAAVAADDKKGVKVMVLDIRQESDVADYMVVASVRPGAPLRALFDHVEDTLLELGIKPLHWEGRQRDRWLALDYGGLVVHILSAEAREFYRLESLWEKAKVVTWESK